MRLKQWRWQQWRHRPEQQSCPTSISLSPSSKFTSPTSLIPEPVSGQTGIGTYTRGPPVPVPTAPIVTLRQLSRSKSSLVLRVWRVILSFLFYKYGRAGKTQLRKIFVHRLWSRSENPLVILDTPSANISLVDGESSRGDNKAAGSITQTQTRPLISTRDYLIPGRQNGITTSPGCANLIF